MRVSNEYAVIIDVYAWRKWAGRRPSLKGSLRGLFLLHIIQKILVYPYEILCNILIYISYL